MSEGLLPSAAGSPASADNKRRLTAALGPGRRQLSCSGALTTAATAATAASFFAVAAVAQELLHGHTGWSEVRGWLLLLVGSAIVRAGAGYVAARLAVAGSLNVELALRGRLLERLLTGRGSGVGSATGATAVMDEVERVGAYAERYEPARVAAMLVPPLVLVAVFAQNWVVGVLLLLCLPLPPINLSIVGMGTATVARKHAEELRYLSGYFLDRLRGLATLNALGAEERELDRVGAASARLADRSMAVLRVAFISAAALDAIVTISVACAAMYIGLTLLGYMHVPWIPGHMSLRTGLFLLMVTPLYFQPMRSLAAAYHERAEALAGIEALAPLLEADATGLVATHGLPGPPAIEVDRLTVAFAGRDWHALQEVSLSVAPYEMVGVTGTSGAGKSTLLRVIAGDLEFSAGTVLLDGIAPADVARTAVTWLGQRPYLFEGTLRENIALGRPDASELEVMQAALVAGLRDVLARLPLGLESPVGERGWGLSGGEAHRVALARTFLTRPPLLLLDEPTAHLDAASEAAIIEVIDRVSGTATTIVATHSPGLLDRCDRVVTLERGRLLDAPRPPVAAENAA